MTTRIIEAAPGVFVEREDMPEFTQPAQWFRYTAAKPMRIESTAFTVGDEMGIGNIGMGDIYTAALCKYVAPDKHKILLAQGHIAARLIDGRVLAHPIDPPDDADAIKPGSPPMVMPRPAFKPAPQVKPEPPNTRRPRRGQH